VNRRSRAIKVSLARRVSPARPVLFVNPASGGGRAVRAGLVARARERGIEVVVPAPGQRLADLVEAAVAGGADALGMAGGDGSLAVVAAAARAHDLPFVCVPAGTRNHFALDLGLDRRDPLRALDAFTDGVERRVDVAEVNGRMFLNNVSLGLYGEAVQRPEYRDAKLRTLVETARLRLGPSAPARGLHLVDDLGREHTGPDVVLVSNNPYALQPPHVPGTRPALDSGTLGIIVLDPPRRAGAPSRAWSATELEVRAPARVHAGIDGEAVVLVGPLAFAARSAGLRVAVPAARPAERERTATLGAVLPRPVSTPAPPDR
jgi:diacylglycerol kinase family enzyme